MAHKISRFHLGNRYLWIRRKTRPGSTAGHLAANRSRVYIIGVVVVSLLIDAPRFLELEARDVDPARPGGRLMLVDRTNNGWTALASATTLTYTKLRRNQLYIKVYTLWFRLFVTAVIPFVLMFAFNLRILIYYRANRFVEDSNDLRNDYYLKFRWFS